MILRSSTKQPTLMLSAIEVYVTNSTNIKHFDLLIDEDSNAKESKPQNSLQLAITKDTMMQTIVERIGSNAHFILISNNYMSLRGHIPQTIFHQYRQIKTTLATIIFTINLDSTAIHERNHATDIPTANNNQTQSSEIGKIPH
ncbi:hypothetical protein RFI_38373 [Reticulomyxa filosa]|uniref:Uncharacterized protein n=1 Tax=Reticulomyxa filosa TaxID=46433 RepID=X6LED1_RETFI|nr:hypothetical protein RFI_38373 [Reticulomyxa filosa]|eukprot:ETN99114.1 hypothetical protein RFI_38373 [Reticulomyxa filosa]